MGEAIETDEPELPADAHAYAAIDSCPKISTTIIAITVNTRLTGRRMGWIRTSLGVGDG